MKKTTTYQPKRGKWKMVLLCTTMLFLGTLSAQVKEFQVESRMPVRAGAAEFLGLTNNNTAVYYQMAKERDRAVYKVSGTSGTVTIDALSNIEYARHADRIVTYGDSLHHHVVTNVYVKIYSGSGALIRSLGPVAYWPFVATVAENGDFIVAGNKNKTGEPQMVMACFDKDGNKVWERSLPNMAPQNCYVAADRKYIALAMYHTESQRSHLSIYNSQGTVLYTNWVTGVTGVAFLPSEKAVVSFGNQWRLYDLTQTFALVGSGQTEGKTIGRYPITAHPTKEVFIMVSLASHPFRGYRVQALDSRDGSLLQESVWAGDPYWQPYRLVEIVAPDRIRLITTNEMIDLRLSQ